MYVLLVEDSPTDADMLRRVFLRSGYEEWKLVHVERLEDAIRRSQQQRFDVVLLDLRLPDSDGFETVKEFQAAIPNLPVIVLTKVDDENLALQAVAEGAQDYLVKDQITIHLLMRSIRYAIERGRVLQRLKNSEQSMMRALEQEKELNLLKSSFISMASHELRTPMTMIRTCVELLQNYNNELTQEKRNQYFDRIKSAIHQITHLLDEVLLLGSTKSGGLRFQPQPLDLEAFCRELSDAMQFGSNSRHSISLTFQGTCTQTEMDTDLLRYILTNLLSNAIKYSPEGGNITFTVNCQDDFATFQIKDQGIGIPPKDQPHLFETFYRCTNVGSIKGTGLGLAIVKKCTELHQGQIRVSSEPCKGTTFTLTLPVRPSDAQCESSRL